jgi:hypothetical protein
MENTVHIHINNWYLMKLKLNELYFWVFCDNRKKNRN